MKTKINKDEISNEEFLKQVEEKFNPLEILNAIIEIKTFDRMINKDKTYLIDELNKILKSKIDNAIKNFSKTIMEKMINPNDEDVKNLLKNLKLKEKENDNK